MGTIYCVKCKNYDPEHPRCKKYGEDAIEAGQKCVEHRFANYKPVQEAPDEDS